MTWYYQKAMRKILGLLLTAYNLQLTTAALAVCPVCTVAVGAGLGLSRYLGIDDTISGLWVGGLILSSSFWLTDFLSKKNVQFKFPYLTLIIIILMLVLVIVPLQISGVIGHPYNTILGVDKLLFGTVMGSFVFLLAVKVDRKVRQIYGHQLFSYQKVVFPLTFLIIISLIFFLTIKT